MKHTRGWLIILLLLGAGLSACERSTSVAKGTQGFIAPTVAATEPIVQVSDNLTPTVSTDCTNVLSFDKDITIPDGTEVSPGQALDKRWQVRNNGTCDWTDQYTIKLIAGQPLGGPETQGLFPARSGSLAIITMSLTAPTEEGTYRSAWQAFTPNGDEFQDAFYIEIVVVAKQATP